ncbi:MAG: uL15 family ribosomal protein [Candidatus Hodarchaeota archaeon]
MVIRKPRKIRKMRGSRTHGYGRVSGGHRKGGQRGGKGAAGRKGQHMIHYILSDMQRERGFSNPTRKDIKAINIGQLLEMANQLLSEGKAQKEGDLLSIDVSALGYNKVLGKGIVKQKVKIITPAISKQAEEKITALGGQIILKN